MCTQGDRAVYMPCHSVNRLYDPWPSWLDVSPLSLHASRQLLSVIYDQRGWNAFTFSGGVAHIISVCLTMLAASVAPNQKGSATLTPPHYSSQLYWNWLSLSLSSVLFTFFIFTFAPVFFISFFFRFLSFVFFQDFCAKQSAQSVLFWSSFPSCSYIPQTITLFSYYLSFFIHKNQRKRKQLFLVVVKELI